MKCIVLAGGNGNRIWPMSRKNYPKQFIPLREDTSLFQETIVRNMPYCDEFWIMTGANYRNIVDAQMQVFQNLRYRCFCEESGGKTRAAVMLAAVLAQEADSLLIVNSDTIIPREETSHLYKEAIQKARAQAEAGKIACIGVEPQNFNLISGFVSDYAGRVTYLMPEQKGDAMALVESGHWLWDTGMMAASVGTLRRAFEKICPQEYRQMLSAGEKVYRNEKNDDIVPASVYQNLTSVSVGKGLLGLAEESVLVKGEFPWNHLVDMGSAREIYGGLDLGNTLQESCENTTILNYVPHRLVAANGLKDITVVCTEDVTYITQNSSGYENNAMIPKNDEQRTYFDETSVYYTTWGTKTMIDYGRGYQVRRLVIHPGNALSCHVHYNHSEQWSVICGTVTITLDGVTREYHENESISAPIGCRHQVSNESAGDVILIEVSQGMTDDGMGFQREEPEESGVDNVVKLSPSFKDYLWGGTALRDVYQKKCALDVIAESWELSAHEAGQCSVASGLHVGASFGEYLSLIGRKHWGWKCQAYDRFPILVKFIDAREKLSIQVHPDDDYALKHENEYGKNEMWYVCEAAPGACLYMGLKKPVSDEEIRRRIEDDTLLEILNQVPVKKGETFFIKSGTIHAIGEGLMICEVQQSSNVTYRLYDYGRRDQQGNQRPLHVEQALQVMEKEARGICETTSARLLCECKYFYVEKYVVADELQLNYSEASFVCIVILEGKGSISVKKASVEAAENDLETLVFRTADTFFLPARRGVIQIIGKCEFLKIEV